MLLNDGACVGYNHKEPTAVELDGQTATVND